MKHFVITMGCEFGSGGPEIGKMLAKSLGIEYYDRDLVDKVVEKIGVEKHLVEEADNKNFVPYGIETSLGTRYANLSNKVIYTQDVMSKDTRPIVDGLLGVSDGRAKKGRPDHGRRQRHWGSGGTQAGPGRF